MDGKTKELEVDGDTRMRKWKEGLKAISSSICNRPSPRPGCAQAKVRCSCCSAQLCFLTPEPIQDRCVVCAPDPQTRTEAARSPEHELVV